MGTSGLFPERRLLVSDDHDASVTDFARARDDLVAHMKRTQYVRSPAVERAFRTVPRELFVPEDRQRAAYHDSPLPIPKGQTISAPSMIAIMLEEGEFAPGQKVLDVGSGSGYNAALLAELVGPENVVSIERLPDLVAFARANLAAARYAVEVVEGDGTRGYEPGAPYDRIIVTAGAPRLAKSWIRQTQLGGLILAPIGRSTFSQTLVIAEKTAEGDVKKRNSTACAFVPLVGAEGW